MTKPHTTALYLDEEDMLDLAVVLDAADILVEEQGRLGDHDEELEYAVTNISAIAGIDMSEVRHARALEEASEE
jgi:hypothetical protein